MLKQYQVSFSQSEIEMLSDMASCYFDAHYSPQSREQETAPLLEMILEIRGKLNEVLTCEMAECGDRRDGLDSFCTDHAASRDARRAHWEEYGSRDSRDSYRRDLQESGRGHLLRD